LSYFTVVPNKDKLEKYIADFTKYLNQHNSNLWILGRQIQHINKEKLPPHIRTFDSIEQLSKAL
jgi:MerR family transcriptional regulator, light-induced transcriptional regulator